VPMLCFILTVMWLETEIIVEGFWQVSQSSIVIILEQQTKECKVWTAVCDWMDASTGISSSACGGGG
jgi:hypothetical protein